MTARYRSDGKTEMTAASAWSLITAISLETFRDTCSSVHPSNSFLNVIASFILKYSIDGEDLKAAFQAG
jgi:hypothetical protein